MTVALVLGGARCVYADVEAALALGHFDGVVACNDITTRWPGPLAAAVSKHPERWAGWLNQRADAGHAPPARIFAHLEVRNATPKALRHVTDFTEFRFPGQTGTGSSGLFALKVALVDLGFDRAVLCGVPISEMAGHVTNGPVWSDAPHYREAWTEAAPEIIGRARSMSGWTRDLLGAPTADWIAR